MFEKNSVDTNDTFNFRIKLFCYIGYILPREIIYVVSLNVFYLRNTTFFSSDYL